jgi:hypothetical protein
VTLPLAVREELQERLYQLASQVDWTNLSASSKAKHYEQWTRSAEIGGVLARFMDRGKIRVYLKDTLLKDYSRKAIADASRPMRVLGLPDSSSVSDRFIKPHGLRLKYWSGAAQKTGS